MSILHSSILSQNLFTWNGFLFKGSIVAHTATRPALALQSELTIPTNCLPKGMLLVKQGRQFKQMLHSAGRSRNDYRPMLHRPTYPKAVNKR